MAPLHPQRGLRFMGLWGNCRGGEGASGKWIIGNGKRKVQGSQVCHCEEAEGRRGNLGKALPSRTGCRKNVQTQSVHTILTVACSYRQHCAGSGMPLPYKGMCDWRLCHQTCSLHGASCPQRARCVRFLQKSSKNHDFHLADFAFVWYIFILWTKNLLGNTAQLQLRPSPDIFRRSIGLKSLRYTKYICTFQTLSRQKISRRMLLLNHALLP